MNRSILRLIGDHDHRRAAFRSRQQFLAAAGVWTLLLAMVSTPWLAAFTVLFFQTAADEALRYRRTGCELQTRRSIWKGTTRLDACKRHLLNGWTYPYGVAA